MGLFTSEPTPIERAVIKATDEKLTGEDWTRIIEVCDEVNTKPTKNAPLAVQALKKRLATPNGNVQLYSLTLLNALAQNCGPSAQREIASAPMTSSLSALGLNPATHRSVLVRLLDILDQLATQFSADPTLAQIQMVYDRIVKVHPSLAKKAAKGSSSRPSKPQATRPPVQPAASNVDDDDEDLRRAMELSLKEMGRPQLDAAAEVEAAAARPVTAQKHLVRALYDFTATEDGELSFQTGDVLEVVDRVYKEWWKGVLDGREGIFPVNYVEDVANPLTEQATAQSTTHSVAQSAHSAHSRAQSTAQSTTQSTTQSTQFREASPIDTASEEYIFAQVPAVEKLLAILASAGRSDAGSSVIGNADVQQLYHRVASMRPRLVQLIDEYAAKKQELVELNQKLLQAHRGYEQLLADAASGYRYAPQHTPQQAPHQAPQQAQRTSGSVHSQASQASQPFAHSQVPHQAPHAQPTVQAQQPLGHSQAQHAQSPSIAQSPQFANAQLPQFAHAQHFTQPPVSHAAQPGQFAHSFAQPVAYGQVPGQYAFQSSAEPTGSSGYTAYAHVQQPMASGWSMQHPLAQDPKYQSPPVQSPPVQSPQQTAQSPQLGRPVSGQHTFQYAQTPQSPTRLPYPDDRAVPYTNGVASRQ